MATEHSGGIKACDARVVADVGRDPRNGGGVQSPKVQRFRTAASGSKEVGAPDEHGQREGGRLGGVKRKRDLRSQAAQNTRP